MSLVALRFTLFPAAAVPVAYAIPTLAIPAKPTTNISTADSAASPVVEMKSTIEPELENVAETEIESAAERVKALEERVCELETALDRVTKECAAKEDEKQQQMLKYQSLERENARLESLIDASSAALDAYEKLAKSSLQCAVDPVDITTSSETDTDTGRDSNASSSESEDVPVVDSDCVEELRPFDFEIIMYTRERVRSARETMRVEAAREALEEIGFPYEIQQLSPSEEVDFATIYEAATGLETNCCLYPHVLLWNADFTEPKYLSPATLKILRTLLR